MLTQVHYKAFEDVFDWIISHPSFNCVLHQKLLKEVKNTEVQLKPYFYRNIIISLFRSDFSFYTQLLNENKISKDIAEYCIENLISYYFEYAEYNHVNLIAKLLLKQNNKDLSKKLCKKIINLRRNKSLQHRLTSVFFKNDSTFLLFQKYHKLISSKLIEKDKNLFKQQQRLIISNKIECF